LVEKRTPLLVELVVFSLKSFTHKLFFLKKEVKNLNISQMLIKASCHVFSSKDTILDFLCDLIEQQSNSEKFKNY